MDHELFSDYFHSQIDEIIDNITDIRSPAYTYIFLKINLRIQWE